MQGSHASINHRKICFATAPSRKTFFIKLIKFSFAKSVELSIKILKLDFRLGLKLLNEMTMPPKSAFKLV